MNIGILGHMTENTEIKVGRRMSSVHAYKTQKTNSS